MKQESDYSVLIESIKQHLSENQSEELFAHSIRTCECALKLNRDLNLGLDENRVSIAALLHDLAKEYPSKKYFEIAAEMEYTFNEIEIRNPYLMHQWISAIEAERIFGIEDQKVLSAIMSHTTGADQMTNFDLLIFAADKIEPGREYKSLERLRQEIHKDFLGGCLAILEENKKYILEKGKEFHPDSDIAITYLKKRIADSMHSRVTIPVKKSISPENKQSIAKSYVTLDHYIFKCALVAIFITIVFTFIGSLFYSIQREWNRIGAETDDEKASDTQKPYSYYFGGRKELLFLICGLDEVEGSSRTDTIILARLDFNEPKLKMVSIPRDTYVKIPTSRGGQWNRINAAFAVGGSQKLIETVENLTGHNPDYLILVDFKGFVNIVDLVGGVEIDVDRNMIYNDYAGNLHINIQKGLQVLDGKQALDYVRYRQYTDGDFSRIRNQQKFLKAFKDSFFKTQDVRKLDKIVSNIINNVSIVAVNSEKEDSIITDKNLSFHQYITLAKAFQNTQVENITIDTLKMVDHKVLVNGHDVLIPDYKDFDITMHDFFEN